MANLTNTLSYKDRCFSLMSTSSIFTILMAGMCNTFITLCILGLLQASGVFAALALILSPPAGSIVTAILLARHNRKVFSNT